MQLPDSVPAGRPLSTIARVARPDGANVTATLTGPCASSPQAVGPTSMPRMAARAASESKDDRAGTASSCFSVDRAGTASSFLSEDRVATAPVFLSDVLGASEFLDASELLGVGEGMLDTIVVGGTEAMGDSCNGSLVGRVDEFGSALAATGVASSSMNWLGIIAASSVHDGPAFIEGPWPGRPSPAVALAGECRAFDTSCPRNASADPIGAPIIAPATNIVSARRNGPERFLA